MEKEVKKIMDRNRRREARAASREARAARREARRAARGNKDGVDHIKKSAASSLRQVMKENKDLTGDVTKQAVNETIGTTVDKVIDKGAETIGKAFDTGIKQVSNLFDNEKQTEENYSDVASLNEEIDEDLYFEESANQNNYTSSPASDNTSGSWFGCIFWIFIGFLILVIFF